MRWELSIPAFDLDLGQRVPGRRVRPIAKGEPSMEMQAAPSVPILKQFGGEGTSELIQKGRVEVVVFFFLRCAPCLREMPMLSEFQKRYSTDGVIAAEVTSYKMALSPDSPTHAEVETALDKTRKEKAPDLFMVVTSNDALANYKVPAFPVVAVIDKACRVRYVGEEVSFDPHDRIDRLIRKLIQE
jgi:thiol-disulfide isomerase/thioredoxin